MKTTSVLLAVVGAALISDFPTLAFASTESGSGPDATTTLAQPSSPTADNTVSNRGDGAADAITPLKQSNIPEDTKVTKQIRQALIHEKGFSVNAQNIKIITTADQMVYLRGVVISEQERIRIVEIAKTFLGQRQLKNELTVRS